MVELKASIWHLTQQLPRLPRHRRHISRVMVAVTNYFWSSPPQPCEVSCFHLPRLDLLARDKTFPASQSKEVQRLSFLKPVTCCCDSQWMEALKKAKLPLCFFLPLGLTCSAFRRFLHGLFSFYKTNRAVRQNVLWELVIGYGRVKLLQPAGNNTILSTQHHHEISPKKKNMIFFFSLFANLTI